MSRGRYVSGLLAALLWASPALAAPPSLSGPSPAPRAAITEPPATPAPSSAPGAPAAPRDPSTVIAMVSERNASLEGYTFSLRVKIAMHTFPWLQPYVIGNGSYQKPGHYTVNFRHVPALAKSYQQVNGVMLDPANWSQKYVITLGKESGSDVELILHERIKGEITEARAIVDTSSGTVKRMRFRYEHGGTIDIRQRSQVIDGFVLPVAQDAEIAMPGIKATAHAEIFDYHLQAGSAQLGGASQTSAEASSGALHLVRN